MRVDGVAKAVGAAFAAQELEARADRLAEKMQGSVDALKERVVAGQVRNRYPSRKTTPAGGLRL